MTFRLIKIRIRGEAPVTIVPKFRLHRIRVMLPIPPTFYRYNGTEWVPQKVTIL